MKRFGADDDDVNFSFFAHFEGRQDCGISSRDIYEAPPLTTTTAGEKQDQAKTELPFCRNRATLLEAMNGGGRHGFDAPFWPKGEYLSCGVMFY